MSEEIHFDPVPGVEFIRSTTPTAIVDLVVRQCPPGTPAPPRPDRPHLPKKRLPSEHGQEDSASADE